MFFFAHNTPQQQKCGKIMKEKYHINMGFLFQLVRKKNKHCLYVWCIFMFVSCYCMTTEMKNLHETYIIWISYESSHHSNGRWFNCIENKGPQH